MLDDADLEWLDHVRQRGLSYCLALLAWRFGIHDVYHALAHLVSDQTPSL